MKLIYLLLTLFCLSSLVFAEDFRPTVKVNTQVEVTKDKVYFGDIANISGDDQLFTKLITDLKIIDLGDAPRPMGSRIIKGEEILSVIDSRGIPREAYGYSLPSQITVSRAGRVLINQEVLESIKNKINSDSALDIQVRNVRWDIEQVIPLGASRIESEILGKPSQGKMPVRVSVLMDNNLVSKFLATAYVDDWKSIPVLKSKVERGMLISSNDIQMIRANITNLPQDIATDPREIEGKRVVRSVALGEPLRRSDLDIPPAVEKGKLIKMKFQSGSFTAIATGLAMQSGHLDETIEVKNERSNKVVKGKIISGEEVLINN